MRNGQEGNAAGADQGVAVAQAPSEAAPATGAAVEEPEPERDLARTILFYLPNRVFDVFDILRLRLRVGPGFGAGVRFTEAIDLYLGGYASLWAGLPGPRGKTFPSLPFGVESKSGAEISVLDATLKGPIGPEYGPLEVGLDFQLLVFGVAIGVAPSEVVDLVVGFAAQDLRGDDF